MRKCSVRGSLSVEVALVLPIFVFAFVMLISLGEILGVHMKIQKALYDEAFLLSQRCSDGHSEAISAVSSQIQDSLEKYGLDYRYISDGAEGIDFLDSRVSDGEYIELIARYYCKPMFVDRFGIAGIPVTQKILMHSFSGYEGEYFEVDAGDYVYITSGSEVFHRSRECSHLVLSLKAVQRDIVSTLRNDEGAKYYLCDICKDTNASDTVYITKEGNRYHNKITCSGLKRKVWAIRIEQSGNRRPCSRCGNKLY